MPSGHRKKPFSNKQRKEQLKAKREQKKNQDRDEYGNVVRHHKGKHPKGKCNASDDSSEHESVEVRQMNPQPDSEKGYDPNRYRLHFLKESKDEIERRKQLARLPLQILPEKDMEMDLADIYVPGSVLDMPKRPPWEYKMTKHQVEAREERYFKNYLENILEKYDTEELSYFEVNLETWRQLWRVVEMADVILLITDIRHPALHFCPTFYNYITKELHKPLILVLNKIDLVPASLVVAWKDYFQQKYLDLYIICFTSFPKDKKEQITSPEKADEVLSQTRGAINTCWHLKNKIKDKGTCCDLIFCQELHKKRKRGTFSAVGPKQLLEVCEKIVQGHVDLKSWREKIDHEIKGIEPKIESQISIEEGTDYYHYEQAGQYKNGILSIGCCGYPNVGKSSLINGLMGKKVVSVSKTPGHTKHFQTIFLTPHVKLCDSPGLVFPSLVPKPMQILAGIYPIAQVREPFTTVGYLSERISVRQLLKLTHPETDLKSHTEIHHLQWSAMDVCDAWAEKRRFLTAKAARNDVYRAANSILRLALEGRLIMCTRPPGYTNQKVHWEKHPESNEISFLQEMHRKVTRKNDSEEEEIMSQDTSESDTEESDSADSDNDEQCAGTSCGTSNPFALLADG